MVKLGSSGAGLIEQITFAGSPRCEREGVTGVWQETAVVNRNVICKQIFEVGVKV